MIASNLPYIAHDVPIAPKARHDDGLIHLVLFKVSLSSRHPTPKGWWILEFDNCLSCCFDGSCQILKSDCVARGAAEFKGLNIFLRLGLVNTLTLKESQFCVASQLKCLQISLFF